MNESKELVDSAQLPLSLYNRALAAWKRNRHYCKPPFNDFYCISVPEILMAGYTVEETTEKLIRMFDNYP